MNVVREHPSPHERRSRLPSSACARACAPLVLAVLAIEGCATPPPKDPDKVNINDAAQRTADREFVREPFSDQARQGVIRQRTLYEIHFVTDSSRLSALGRRDVAILADALHATGGRISVRRGTASDALHAERIAEVRRTLIAAGVDASRVMIDDRFPGGTGTTTEDALLIRADIRAAPMPPISDAPVPPQGATPPTPVPTP